MQDRAVNTLTGVVVPETAIEELRASLRGELIRPGDEAYDGARRIYNGMIDKHPALIVRCMGIADVIDAINFARNNNLLVAIRGGGHNVAGTSLSDRGMVVDLSRM